MECAGVRAWWRLGLLIFLREVRSMSNNENILMSANFLIHCPISPQKSVAQNQPAGGQMIMAHP